jgi:hypothetical protein
VTNLIANYSILFSNSVQIQIKLYCNEFKAMSFMIPCLEMCKKTNVYL